MQEIRFFLFVLFLSLSTVNLSAQGQTGIFEVSGKVVSKEGQRGISGVEVSTDKGTYTLTNALGEFKIDVRVGDVNLNVSASLGIALYPDHSLTLETLLNCADQAMYYAKNHNQKTSFFEPDSTEAFPDRLQLMAALPDAIQNGELRLWYQPQLSLQTEPGNECKVEALVRWQHPVQGILFPSDFLPLAEQANAIKAMTEWVIHETLEAILRFKKRGYILNVAVNLSVKVIDDMSMADWIKSAVTQASVDPQSICFEVTESSEMVNSQENKAYWMPWKRPGFALVSMILVLATLPSRC